MIMRSSSRKQNDKITKWKNQFHDVRMTQMELVFCYLLFYDGVDFIQLFFGERSMSDDTDIV